ncbi:MAG: hypothetical protein LJE94_09855 [Deltaproteobacteria bacterium]|nr:hypothetical protein [Deltaproteobacteria bacterium]
MKASVILLLIWGLLLSCSRLPEIVPADQAPLPVADFACRNLFPEGNWQLTHAIEATLPGNRKGFMLGVTVLSSATRSVKMVIMTLEGFVVFEARHEGQTTSIDRAVAPFDSDAFARGLMADIDLIFFKPQAVREIRGVFNGDTAGCRYHLRDDGVVDVVKTADNRWETRQYLASHRLVRTVKSVYDPKNSGIAKKIALTAYGHPGYALAMDLLEAIPLGDD